MRYEARSPWSPLAALLAVGAILVGALATGLVVADLVTKGASAGGEPTRVAVSMLVMQGTAILAAIAASSLWNGSPSAVLSLDRWPGWRALLVTCLGALAILLPYNLVVYLVAPKAFAADLAPFRDIILSPAAALFFVVIAVGAPVSEELVFRGFLQSALTKSRLGFWGASAVTTTLWTAMHAGYSLAGLIEVFLIGLYFAYVLWRTGSLWLPIFGHAIYNATLFMVLRYVPLPF
jgi:membrane protease YdiL (CAAX protease family)